jgi:hypothetical protein
MTFEILWQEYEDTRQSLNAIEPTQGPAKIDPNVDELRSELKRKAQVVLGHPYSFDHIKCWMVDAVGYHTECDVSPELVADMECFSHRYMDRFGALPSEVRLFITNWDLTDSGGGCNSWHIGCHCTESEARSLCSALHEHFKHAIAMGILTIRRTPWSLKLKTAD